MEPGAYLAEITARLVASTVVAEVTIVEEYVLPDRGYFRARLSLSNHDFLEDVSRVCQPLSKQHVLGCVWDHSN